MTRHRTDPLSLFFGVVFVAIAGVAWTGGLSLHSLDLGWLWPSLLIAAAVALLAGLARDDATDPSVASLDEPTGHEWEGADADG